MAERRKCLRCGKRRTMQTAILWRPRGEAEHVPVCGGCWLDLITAHVAFNHAVATPGVRLTIDKGEESTPGAPPVPPRDKG